MAVFTHISRDELEALLAHYGIGSLVSYEGILQGIDNSNFIVSTTKEKVILTLFESRIEPRDIPYFLGLMAHLSKSGINCPAPIEDNSKNALSTIREKPCAFFSFLDGRDTKAEDITPDLCTELGEALAKMHLAGTTTSLTRPNSMGYEAWAMRVNKVGLKANTIETGLAAALESELSFLKENWPRNLPVGNIHADLFPDNVFIKEGHIFGVIDFYFAATDMLAYDLAIVMNAWCFDSDIHFREERWKSLLAGYESYRSLTSDEKRHYQILCRGAAMRFLSSRLHDLVFHDPDALVKPKPPTEYIRKLDFHRATKLF